MSEAGAAAAPPLLLAAGLGKAYGAVTALSDVGFALAAGEVLAVCGDNGAGKSTLIKILSGAQPPSSGSVTLRGERVAFASPAEALSAGVATIYQDLALAPNLSIVENIYLGSELLRAPRLPAVRVLDKRAMAAGARQLLSRLKIDIADVGRKVSALSGGQRQAVAIARALRWQADIVIMDEPTAALGVRETREVLGLIEEIRAQGIAVILVSHAMKDVIAVADRALILQSGRLSRDIPLAGWTPDGLMNAIMAEDA
ncbi:MAG: ATP-binding cassette domain-containing protein [Acuticoccus sp.]